jgi:hypothetical protein
MRPNNPWEMPISHMVPSDVLADTKNDASHKGIGFHREKLRFYGVVPLSTYTYRRCVLDNPQKIHINELEMIGAILSFDVAITPTGTPTAHHVPNTHRLVVDPPPISATDNTITKVPGRTRPPKIMPQQAPGSTPMTQSWASLLPSPSLVSEIQSVRCPTAARRRLLNRRSPLDVSFPPYSTVSRSSTLSSQAIIP